MAIAEGVHLVNDAGEIRIDRVADGWVYYVAWRHDAGDTGAPIRKPIAEFGALVEAEGMREVTLARVRALEAALREALLIARQRNEHWHSAAIALDDDEEAEEETDRARLNTQKQIDALRSVLTGKAAP